MLGDGCAKWGADTLGDSAYYFETFREPLDIAGRAVADAWMADCHSIQKGLASQVRAIYSRAEAEAASSRAAVSGGIS